MTVQKLYILSIQMFEELKSIIGRENITKVKANQQKINNADHSHSSDSSGDYSEDLDLADRRESFKLLMNEQQNISEVKYKRNQYDYDKSRKYLKQAQLLQEKIKINEEMHQKQMEHIKEKYEREMAVLKAQIQKYVFCQKRQLKEEGVVLNLKRQNRQLMELHQQCSKIVEKQTNQIMNLRKETLQLKIIIKKKEEKEAKIHSDKYESSSAEQKLKQEIAFLEKQRLLDCERKKQLQGIVQKYRQQNDNLLREVDRMSVTLQFQKDQSRQIFKSQLNKIEEQNRQLKKRNQVLQESFIEHLTQTSMNLQQTIKVMPERQQKSIKNTTLYLQSPIRAKSKQNQRIKSPKDEDDPQKSNIKICKCMPQIQKLKRKLDQANTKIVELLKQKCQNNGRVSIRH